MLIQSGMIGRLIFERHRRQAAEEETRRRVLQVIHLNRTATAGALSASVAHELNQPLGAILNYAETADVLLAEKSVNVQLLKEIIADIRRDDQRASDVITHLRALLKQRSETELQTFDLNDAIDVAIRILGPEATKRGIALDTTHANAAFPVRADQVQLQQVILIWLPTGWMPSRTLRRSRRRLMVQAIPSGKSDVEVLVSDWGRVLPKMPLERSSIPSTRPRRPERALVCRLPVRSSNLTEEKSGRKIGKAVARYFDLRCR